MRKQLLTTDDLESLVATGNLSSSNVEDFMAIAASPTLAVEAAIVDATAANTRQGVVEFGQGRTYTLTDRPVQLTRNLLGLDIDLNGATVKLTVAAPRAFDFTRIADHDMFRRIRIHDGTVDADNVGGKHHVIVGNCMDFAGGTAHAVNFEHCRVQRVRAINVPVGTDSAVDLRVGVAFQSWNNGDAPDPQNTIKDVVIEDVHVEGGLVGIQIAGFPYGGGITQANVWIDDVHVKGGSHVAPVPTSFLPGNHVIIGNKGWGDWATVTDFRGVGCSDCGIEVNAMQDFVGTRNHVEDSWNHGYYHVNYHAPLNAFSQLHRLKDCTGVRTSSMTNATSNGVHYNTKSAGGSYPANVHLVGFRWTDTSPLFNGSGGDAVTIGGSARSLVRDFFGYRDHGNYAGVASVASVMVWVDSLDSSTRTRPVLDGVRAKVVGAKSSGTVTDTVIRVGKIGFTDFRIAEPEVDFAATSCICVGITVGDSASTPTVRGTIDKFSGASAGASSASGIVVHGTATTTIAGAVTITDPDFSLMQSGATEVNFQGVTNAARVQVVRPRWRTAKTPSAITVTASPFTYQNLDGYTERVIVRGGTVSLVELSADNANFEDVGAVAGTLLVEPGAAVRVTYSAAPTVRKVPPGATAVA